MFLIYYSSFASGITYISNPRLTGTKKGFTVSTTPPSNILYMLSAVNEYQGLYPAIIRGLQISTSVLM